jgi:hypothetical protein
MAISRLLISLGFCRNITARTARQRRCCCIIDRLLCKNKNVGHLRYNGNDIQACHQGCK